MDIDLRALLTLLVFMILPAIVIVLIYAVIFFRRGRRKRQRITSKSGRHREAHKEENEKV